MEFKDYTIDEQKMPYHIGIIMDGNGRWAKKRKQPRLFGHHAGMKSLHSIVKTASNINIKVLSVYAFSTENWKRSEEEVNGLMNIAVEYFIKEINELHENNVKVQLLGNIGGLPEEVQKAASKAIARTADNNGLILNVMLNYGSRDEITHAVRAIIKEGLPAEAITENTISNHLYTCGLADPDIMIRTGGDNRLSNFMLWQNAYTEFFFVDTLWPDFNDADLLSIIQAYQNRDRRFGKA